MDIAIGTIQTVVGTGEEGYAGDGGPATQALIGEAYGCDFDRAGNLYISDGRTHTIRRIVAITATIHLDEYTPFCPCMSGPHE